MSSDELLNKVEEILKKVDLPDRHSFFQLEKFVIGREPTAQAQLWQIIREIQVRFETINNYQEQLKDAEDDLELLEVQIERLNRKIRSEREDGNKDLNIQESEINIRKLQRKRDSLAKSAQKANKKRKSVTEELAFLTSAYENIVTQYGETKPFDDAQSQQEMWNEKLLEEFNLRAVLNRPLEIEFIRTALCLNNDAPVKKHVVALLTHIQNEMRQKLKLEGKNG